MIRELWEAIKNDEGIKEGARLLVFSFISVVITFAISVVSPMAIDGRTDTAIWGLVLIILRAVDRKMHEAAPKGEAGGLLPF